MRKNPYDRILKGKLKEQYLSTVPKSCSLFRDYGHSFETLEITNEL